MHYGFCTGSANNCGFMLLLISTLKCCYFQNYLYIKTSYFNGVCLKADSFSTDTQPDATPKECLTDYSYNPKMVKTLMS